jgi:hypothetical protein
VKVVDTLLNGSAGQLDEVRVPGGRAGGRGRAGAGRLRWASPHNRRVQSIGSLFVAAAQRQSLLPGPAGGQGPALTASLKFSALVMSFVSKHKRLVRAAQGAQRPLAVRDSPRRPSRTRAP